MTRARAAAPPVDAFGEGESVLLLHGLGSSAHVFDPLRALWPAGLRGVAVELPCCGRAGRWAAMSPPEIARALAAHLRAGGVSPVAVVGHSFGGLVALELAALGVVPRALLLAAPVGGAGRLGAAGGSGLGQWTLRVAGRVEPSAPAVRAWLSWIWGEGPPPTPGMVQGYLHALSAEGHAAATAEALASLGRWSPPALPAGAQVSLVQGRKDPLVSVDEAAAFCRATGAELQLLTEVGHCIPEEAPEAVAAWLARLEKAAAGRGAC